MKLRFDTFKAETLPTVELFKSKSKCVEVDASRGGGGVYGVLGDRCCHSRSTVDLRGGPSRSPVRCCRKQTGIAA